MKRSAASLILALFVLAQFACGVTGQIPTPYTAPPTGPATSLPVTGPTSIPPTITVSSIPPTITPSPIPPIGSVERIQGSVKAGPEANLVQVDSERDMNNNDAVHVSDSGKAKLDFGYGLVFTLYNDSTAGGTSVDKSGTSIQAAAKLSTGGLKGFNPEGCRTEVDLPDGGRIFILGTEYFIAYDPAQDIAWVYNFDGTVQYSFNGSGPTDLPARSLLSFNPARGILIAPNQSFSPDDFDQYATRFDSPVRGLNELLHASSPVYQKYVAMGGPTGFLGSPAGPESPTPDGQGSFQDFQGGSIYWTAQAGAHEIQGIIREKWLRLGGASSFLGYPITDETGTPDGVGRFNHFQYGSIYWTPSTGAFEVHGLIRDKWASVGWEQSVLGYPLTDELGTPDGVGRFNHFQYGSIYWTPKTGAHEVNGAIYDLWASLGWETSCLGYPISDEQPSSNRAWARESDFQGGTIFWSPDKGAYKLCESEIPK